MYVSHTSAGTIHKVYFNNYSITQKLCCIYIVITTFQSLNVKQQTIIIKMWEIYVYTYTSTINNKINSYNFYLIYMLLHIWPISIDPRNLVLESQLKIDKFFKEL